MSNSLQRILWLGACSTCLIQPCILGMSTADKALHDALYAGVVGNQSGMAIYQVNLSFVENALKAGANVNMVLKDHDNNTPLIEAVQTQNIPLTELLLKYKANVNAKTADNETPAHIVARPEALTLFDLLVKNGADLKAKNNEGLTAPEALLFRSASNNESAKSIAGIQRALSLGANVNAKDRNGDTPAHRAAMLNARNSLETQKFDVLIKAGADLKIKGNDGLTPAEVLLESATWAHDVENIKKAHELGAPVNTIFYGGNETALSIAARVSDPVLVDLLLKKGADITFKDQEGQTPLHIAAIHGNSAVLNRLLQATPNISAVDAPGNTPLHNAAAVGDLATFNALIAKGADPKIKNKEGYTAPDLLLQGNQGGNATGTPIDAQKRAVELGANVNAQFSGKQTVLHQAADSGDVALAEFLLQHKANVNAQDEYGETPAHKAAASGQVAMLNLLIKNGADMKIKNKEGFTAPDLLLQGNQGGNATGTPIDVQKRAVELGAHVNVQFGGKQTALHQAAGSGNVALAEFLLQHKANVNAQDEYGEAPAHKAAASGQVAMLNLLIKNGADMKIKNKEGYTAPDLLLQSGQGGNATVPGTPIDVQKRAVELGANVNAQFSGKQTALHQAAGSGNLALAEFLLQHKANVNAQDEDGDTPAHEAAYNGHRMLIALLSKHGANMTIKNNEGKTAKEILASRATGNQGGNATIPAKKKAKLKSRKLVTKRPVKTLTDEQKKRLDARIEQLKKLRKK